MLMLNTTGQAEPQIPWPDLFWRLVLTILILAGLTGIGLTTAPEPQTLQALPNEIGVEP